MTPTDVVAMVAATLDGYLARPDGSVDYLETYPIAEFGFDEFVDTIGALIMGSTTYLQTLGWGWPWGDLPTMVLTTKGSLEVPDGANVQFTATPTAEAIRSFSAATPKRLWVHGGGKVITDGLAGGAIDTLDITVMPEAIGSGIPLFAEPYGGPLSVEASTGYANGAVRLIYRTNP